MLKGASGSPGGAGKAGRPAFWHALPPSGRGGFLVFAGALSISFGPLLIKLIDAGATSAAFYRMLFGGVILFPLALVRRERLCPGPGSLLATLLAGAAFSGDLFFWHRSIFLAGPGLATILANFQVFILAALGVIFFGEKASFRLFGSILLAFVGLVLLLETDLRLLPPELSKGVLYGLITSLFLSCYILSLRHSRNLASPLGLIPNMAWVCFFSALFLGGALLLEGGSFSLSGPGEAGALLLYALGCQAAGWLLVSAGLPLLTPGRGGLLLMAEPLFAFLWEALFLGRRTSLVGYGGVIITIFAICLCLNGKARKD
ncbi:MAG: DMT family transporter [Deltaproteobacteria bacterium]|jgi:drug/metabolite transporter (DMT)-like permease|nr:DMT family transporter [Deltaproteobacteria bacterium]